MYENGQGHLTLFCIVFVWLRGRPSTVRSPIQDPWFMYQNRLGPSGGIYYLCLSSSSQLLSYLLSYSVLTTLSKPAEQPEGPPYLSARSPYQRTQGNWVELPRSRYLYQDQAGRTNVFASACDCPASKVVIYCSWRLELSSCTLVQFRFLLRVTVARNLGFSCSELQKSVLWIQEIQLTTPSIFTWKRVQHGGSQTGCGISYR